MHRPNFCAECGARLAKKGWRARLRGSLCAACAGRIDRRPLMKPFGLVALVAIAAFAFGRYLRPAPPPLIIQRAANSPLSDLPIDLSDGVSVTNRKQVGPTNQNAIASSVEDAVYICGARTKKGTPCRRRVHLAGERCYQHKGMPAILPLEKLQIKP